MGKSQPGTETAQLPQRPADRTASFIKTPRTKPTSPKPPRSSAPAGIIAGGSESKRQKLNMNKEMEESNGGSSSNGDREGHRTPLSKVVSDCVRRWFQDTLKEAKAGDVSMQVLVSQMYYNGYGVPRDGNKSRIWMTKASRVRSSVWKVGNKRPGYNASDSDSDELKDES